MNYFKAAKIFPCKRLFPCLILASVMFLSACGGEGTVMTVETTPGDPKNIPADGITAVGISVVVKKDGELKNEGTISFSTNLGTFDNSSTETPLRKTSIELDMGKASVNLYSVQKGTATVRIEYTDPDTGLVDASTELSVLFKYALGPDDPKVATIEFISADPEHIKIFNTSSEGQTSTKLTFRVLDKLNLPIANRTIHFSIPKPLGKSTIVPLDTKSDINGYAVTYLTSGRVAGVAEVVAGTELYGNQSADYVSGTAKIHVVAGSANYNNFSFACAQKSIGGLASYGLQMPCTAYVADRDTQEIPNHPVLFATEAGAVIPLVYTDSEGQATTTYTTQDPIPFPVPVASDTDLTGIYQIDSSDPIFTFLQTLLPTTSRPISPTLSMGEIVSTNPNAIQEGLTYDSNYRTGLTQHNPRDGLVTMIAITAGEELLTKDVNQNGICDDGDTFLSMGEPFIDRNDDGKYNEGEYFLDIDGNGYRTQAEGDADHLPYKLSSDCSKWKKNTQIWKQIKFMWIGEPSYEGFMLKTHSSNTTDLGKYTEFITLAQNEGATFYLYALDKNFNAIPGTTIECSYEGNASITVSPASQFIPTIWGPSKIGQIAVSAVPPPEASYQAGVGQIICNASFTLYPDSEYQVSYILTVEAI